jgi:hypothetical protein
MTIARVAALALLCAATVACTEKPQIMDGHKADQAAWDGAPSGFATKDWKQGDRASWEAHMRTRAQGQNEYLRTAPSAK